MLKYMQNILNQNINISFSAINLFLHTGCSTPNYYLHFKIITFLTCRILKIRMQFKQNLIKSEKLLFSLSSYLTNVLVFSILFN